MNQFTIVTITHKTVSLNQLGKFVVASDDKWSTLHSLREQMGWEELMYLQTCNRVMFLFTSPTMLSAEQTTRLFRIVNPNLSAEEELSLPQLVAIHRGRQAVEHLLSVATSIDSLVIGEREIHKQIRVAYEECAASGLTGDHIRLLIKHTVEVAKRVFTETDISRRPVSVVSLAVGELLRKKVSKEARILLIGAGDTNTLMGKLLLKHGFRHFHIYNRTIANAQILADKVSGQAYSLTDLHNVAGPFDIIISCTGATNHILTADVYHRMTEGIGRQTLIVDLAVPGDVAPEVADLPSVDYINVEYLRTLAQENMDFRKQELNRVSDIIGEELVAFDRLYQQRQLERMLQDVPEEVKAIRQRALEAVFVREVEAMDPASREVMDKVLDYMERKFIGIPYAKARTALR